MVQVIFTYVDSTIARKYCWLNDYTTDRQNCAGNFLYFSQAGDQ